MLTLLIRELLLRGSPSPFGMVSQVAESLQVLWEQRMCRPPTLPYVRVITERHDQLNFVEKPVSACIEAYVGEIIGFTLQVLESQRMFLESRRMFLESRRMFLLGCLNTVQLIPEIILLFRQVAHLSLEGFACQGRVFTLSLQAGTRWLCQSRISTGQYLTYLEWI